jgi:hypothetical protein
MLLRFDNENSQGLLGFCVMQSNVWVLESSLKDLLGVWEEGQTKGGGKCSC